MRAYGYIQRGDSKVIFNCQMSCTFFSSLSVFIFLATGLRRETEILSLVYYQVEVALFMTRTMYITHERLKYVSFTVTILYSTKLKIVDLRVEMMAREVHCFNSEQLLVFIIVRTCIS